MKILMNLSEEVFDFSKGKMTLKKIQDLKSTLNSEFYGIYQLCDKVLMEAKKPSLLLSTLETLLRYLSWIPIGYIFETTLIEVLVTKFLPVVQFRNVSLKCITEIVQLQNINAPYKKKLNNYLYILCNIYNLLYL